MIGCALVALVDVVALATLVVLVRRAPLDPTWSDLRPPRRLRFFDGTTTPDTPGPSVSPPGGRVPYETDDNTTESDES